MHDGHEPAADKDPPGVGNDGVLTSLASVSFLIHLAVNLTGGYGIFRDELYYVACSEHMAWGYVDHPPFSIAMLWLSRSLFGDALFALRLLPALAGAVVVFLAGRVARELGGRKYAQALTACCVLVAPLLLGMNGYFSMNAFDGLFWTTALYLFIRILTCDRRRHWHLLGITLGLGLMNKLSVLWLGAGLMVGLALTSNRKMLLTGRAWTTGLIAFVLLLPHLLWQLAHDFPTLEFMRNATAHKYVGISLVGLLGQQALTMNPLTLPLWLGGLAYFLVSKETRRFRPLPIIYLTVVLILVLNRNSKAEYLGPLFPMLYAAGAVAMERFLPRFRWSWLKPAAIAIILLSGGALAPMAVPVLPVEMFTDYMASLGMAPTTPERKEVGRLPQYFADMFGWKEMVAVIAEAYRTLTPEEQAKCVILCSNYGEAGAVDFFGPRDGLPRAISGHNSYWLWGPGENDGEVVIRLGGSAEAMKASYGDVVQAGVFRDEYCMPYENDQTVWICKGRRRSLKSDWPQFKHFE